MANAKWLMVNSEFASSVALAQLWQSIARKPLPL